MEPQEAPKPETSSPDTDSPTPTDKARSRSILRHLVNSRQGIPGVNGDLPKTEPREPVRTPPLTIGVRG